MEIKFIGDNKGIKFVCVKWILLFVFIIAFCLSVSKCSSYKQKYENSYRQYHDSLLVYSNKYNEIYAMNEAYITDINTLKEENKDLYNEVKSLKDNSIVVVKTKTEYIRDTIIVEQPLILTDTITGDFLANITYKDDWNYFSGRFNGNIYTGNSTFSMDRLQLNCSFTTDIVERNKKLYFVIKPDNPYMYITDINGYLISPEKSKVLRKQFNRPWGVMVGFGCTATVYNNKILFMPGVNLTIGYKIINF